MKLEERRKKLGLTQQEVAEKLGVSRECVSQWENGQSKPRVDTLINLANVLKCSPASLLRSI